jgi:hypothetical protein
VVCWFILHSTIVRLSNRGLSQTVSRKGNTWDAVKVDGETLMVHYHLAIGNFSNAICYMVNGFNAKLVSAKLDAC